MPYRIKWNADEGFGPIKQSVAECARSFERNVGHFGTVQEQNADGTWRDMRLEEVMEFNPRLRARI